MKKTLFIFILSLFASVEIIFASNTKVDGIYYDFDDTNLTATVTYRGSSYSDYSNEYSGDVNIPQTVTYSGKTYSVTSIGSTAFRDCSGLTSVTIPNSVTSIGYSAFSGCSGLTSVTIPNGVTSIGSSTFNGCSSLTSVTIPNSVTSIEYAAFSGCSSLTSVTIPNSVTSIGNRAFYECSSLTSITIPENITHIGSSALYLNSSGKKVRLVWNVRNYTDEWYENRKVGGAYTSNHPFFLRDMDGNISRMSFSSIVLGEEVKSLPQNFIQGITVDSLVYSADMIESNNSFNGTIHYIYSKAVNPLPLYGFSGTAVCYIPCGTTATYLNAWGKYCKQFIEHSRFDVSVSSSNESYGIAKIVSQNSCESAICTAIPAEGYKFVKWSDGNTQAIRYIELTEDVSLTAYFAKEEYTIHIYQDCNTTTE